MSPKRSEVFKAGRREAILAAALGLFLAQGYDRTTMREIAAEAGVSTGAIYVYFQTKSAMLQSLCAEETASERTALLAAMRAVAPGEDPLAVGLGAGFRRYVEASARGVEPTMNPMVDPHTHCGDLVPAVLASHRAVA